MPRQSPPYRPLTEVVAEQHVFELADVSGTMLGFRFPDYAEGIEVSGYHLHFISEDRSRGGHVLGSRSGSTLRVRLDPSGELHVELPRGSSWPTPSSPPATHAAVERVERGELPDSGGVGEALGEPEVAEPVGLLAALAGDDDALGTALDRQFLPAGRVGHVSQGGGEGLGHVVAGAHLAVARFRLELGRRDARP